MSWQLFKIFILREWELYTDQIYIQLKMVKYKIPHYKKKESFGFLRDIMDYLD